MAHDPRVLRRHASPRLVGRDVELAQLADGFGRAADGRAAFVLLSGEPGVGKTRLVGEHASWVEGRGGLVISGECLELGETSLPYGPFRDIIRALPLPLAAEVQGAIASARDHAMAVLAGRAVSVPQRGTDHVAALGEFNAGVLSALEHLAAERPVVMVIEDIHWMDSASRELLAYLVRRSRDMRVQTIATYRSDALHRRHQLVPFLAEAERWPMTERVELRRLDRDGVAAMVEAITGSRPSRALVESVYQRSDGNPFFAEELLAAGSDTGRGIGSLRGVLAADLDRLSDEARPVLAAAAVLGRRPSHELLVGLLGDGPEVMAAIRECVAARLLVPLDRPGEPSYEFRHPLLQEAAYDELLPAERTALHRRAAEILATGVDLTRDVALQRSGEIAYHAHRAHDLPLALAAAAAAGRGGLLTFAHADANRWFAMALGLWEQVPEQERGTLRYDELLEQAAEAAAYEGDPHRAAKLQRQRLEFAPADDPHARAELLHDLFWYHWDAAEVTACPRVAEEAVALLPVDPPTSARAHALADLAFARWSTCANAEAEGLAREAVEVARQVGDAGAEGTALLVLGMALAGLGRTTAADGPFAAAMDRLRDAGDQDGLARTAHWWANTLELDGRFAHGLAVAGDGLRAAIDAGIEARHGDSLRAVVAENLQELGRWDEALALSSHAYDPGADVPSEIWLHGVAARILIGRGEFEAAREHVEASEGVPALGPDRIWQLEEQLNLAYATGDIGRGRRALDAAVSAADDPERESALWWSLTRAMDGEVAAALAAAREGDDWTAADCSERALAAASLLERSAATARAAGGSSRLVDAQVAWVAASRTRLAGRCDPELWRQAVMLRDAIGQRYDGIVGRVRLAEALLERDGHRLEAAGVLEEARSMARSLGLAPVLAEIDALSHRLVAERPSRLAKVAPVESVGNGHDHGNGQHNGTANGSARVADLGLSPRELEVLALVAAGRSNREIGESLFISAKTASVHVTHILDKLGVSSRVEAALLGAAGGLVPESEGSAAPSA